jgi:hypothetical protein
MEKMPRKMKHPIPSFLTSMVVAGIQTMLHSLDFWVPGAKFSCGLVWRSLSLVFYIYHQSNEGTSEE